MNSGNEDSVLSLKMKNDLAGRMAVKIQQEAGGYKILYFKVWSEKILTKKSKFVSLFVEKIYICRLKIEIKEIYY